MLWDRIIRDRSMEMMMMMMIDHFVFMEFQANQSKDGERHQHHSNGALDVIIYKRFYYIYMRQEE